MTMPMIIQGGMGAGVSDWRLANAVSSRGQLGVVSGTALDQVLARRLQLGDPEGHIRRALSYFPFKDVTERILNKYFIEGGLKPEQRFRTPPMWALNASNHHLELSVAASFVEVWLAREGHEGVVGVNLLEKIQLPNLSALYGAMMAGVDYVLMGAGIPWQIPGIIDRFVNHEPASMRIPVEGDAPTVITEMVFEPKAVFPEAGGEPLKRPDFLAIISSATLAMALVKKSTGKLNGFIVEHHTAGGHNAPPRGQQQRNERGEPIYGDRDEMDFEKLRAVGLPFWIAGGAAKPGNLAAALEVGAKGIQVGTAFALCVESGLDPEIRSAVIERVRAGKASVYTDPLASPTGFPFKVVNHPGTVSEEDCYASRVRVCDIGHLRKAYRKPDGGIGYRCPSEPFDDYVKKGGSLDDTAGRKCLCNGLMATIGLAQTKKDGSKEPPIVTAGDDLMRLAKMVPEGQGGFHVQDVLDFLLSAVGSA